MKNIKTLKLNKNKIFFQSLLLIVTTLIVIFVFSGFASVYSTVDSPAFANGLLIDGIDMSGKTYDQAQILMQEEADGLLANMNIILVYADEETEFNSDDLGITINNEATLNEAYYFNRDEADSLVQRFDKTVELTNNTDFNTSIHINEDALRQTIQEYAAQYERNAVDAVAYFDAETQTFTYTEEHDGVHIDIDSLVSQIESKVNEGDFSPLEVFGEAVAPSVKQSDLEQNTKLVASYETTASYNKNRNTNIQLICEAVDGAEIEPGGVLSINELVGERTEGKGYAAAPAIINGMTVDDIGGGICQLAGTLYNAALLANMEIVERVNHTWPSTYLPIGQDATLNWDDKDLKIKNTTGYSIFISARFLDQKVTVRIYGQPLDTGVTIEVQNEIIKEIQPPETQYRYTSELPNGFRETLRKAITGYGVKVYRIYYKNGVETNRELVSWDTYPAISKIVLIGSNTQNK